MPIQLPGQSGPIAIATTAQGDGTVALKLSGLATAPVNTVLPVISGTLAIGQTLTASTGTWIGTAPITYAYQWKRNGVAIGGATNSTYVLTASDPGTAITVTVTATNAAGSASATSAAVNPSSLLTSLVAYYQLEESSGTRVDVTGRGNDVAPNGTVSQATGKIGFGATVGSATTDRISRISTTDLTMGDFDFTLDCWVKLTDTTGDHYMISKWGSGTNEYSLYFSVGNGFIFAINNFAKFIIGSTFGIPSTGTWCYVCGRHDAANDLLRLRVNTTDQTPVATAGSFPGANSQPFALGNPKGINSASSLNGAIDEPGVWKKHLSDAEVTSRYAGGGGTTYPFDGSLPYPAFARYGSTPVVAKGASGSWEATDVANPDVFRDTPNNRWVMNYSGYSNPDNKWKTGLAYSADLLTWTKEAANPVFAPTVGEGYIAANGSIVLKGSTYYLYYNAEDFLTYCATSPDLLTWTRQNGGNAVLPKGAGGSIDSNKTADPMARLADDGITIQIYYSAEDTSFVRCVAWATSIDGVHFTKQGKIVDPPTAAPLNSGEPYAYAFSGANYALTVDTATVSNTRSISLATTTDGGTSWTWRLNRLVGAGGSAWDSVQVFDSSPVVFNGVIYLLYAGAPTTGATENMGAQIGLARANVP